jgi:hypothetical protein
MFFKFDFFAVTASDFRAVKSASETIGDGR